MMIAGFVLQMEMRRRIVAEQVLSVIPRERDVR